MRSLQPGGYDPLDAQLDQATVAPASDGSIQPLRLAGGSASSVPVAWLLLVGIGLGPRSISLLSPGVLSIVDHAMPVALAALGALVGLSTDVRRRAERRTLAAALLESGFTALLVAIPLVVAAPSLLVGQAVPLWMLAGVLGLCAASSLAVPGDALGEPRPLRFRIVELDVLLPIVAGGVLVGAVGRSPAASAFALVGQALVITVLLAAAAWLLVRASSDTEQRVFTFAAMLLVGGVADYLSLSALLSGLVAGTLWRLAGGQASESLRRDVVYIRHSLLVLVLVFAGARSDFSLPSSALAIVYILLRTAARMLAGFVAGRMAGIGEPRELGFQLLSPGIFGVALALETARAVGPATEVLLTIVVFGTIGSELVARLGRSSGREIIRTQSGEMGA
jgi:hypothetical protein